MFGEVGTKSPATAATTTGPQFPIFLLPSLKIPFRRRRASSTEQYHHPDRQQPRSASYSSTASVPSLSSSPESSDSPLSSPASLAGTEPFPDVPDAKRLDASLARTVPIPTPTQPYLARVQPDLLRCGTCATDIAFAAQIVSRGFTGRHGRAVLVSPPSSAGRPSCPASPPPSAREAAAVTADEGRRDLVNVRVGRTENRQLVTGAHTVADISCAVCGTKIGWKYVDAREPAQKYKVGKFILETARVVAHRSWEDVGGGSDVTTTMTTAARPERDPRGFSSLSWPSVDSFGRRISMGTGRVRRKSLAQPGSRGPGSGESSGGRGAEELAEDKTEDAEEIVFDSDDDEECEDIFAGTWDAGVVARRRQSKVANMRKKK